MDNKTLRGYSAMRPWTMQENRYGDTEPSKPLSKLDDARSKLSKFKLKYGKQKRQEEIVSPLSSSLSEESLRMVPLHSSELMDRDSLENEKNSNVISEDSKHQSERAETDSFQVVSEEEKSGKEVDQPPVSLAPENISPQSSISIQQQIVSSPSDSSVSEISENVHSFSSLPALKSELEDYPFHATFEQNEPLVPVPGIEMVSSQERKDSQSRSSVISSVSSELQNEQELVEMVSLLRPTSPQTVPEIPKSQITESSEPEQVVSLETVKGSRNSQSSVESISSKLENRQETRSPSSRPSHEVSSLSLVSDKKEPKLRRNAKVQTDTKKSRRVQVDLSLSWTEPKYENRSCPTLRASSLPPGLHITADDPFDELLAIIDVEDAVQVLLKSQVHLILGLLQREQAVYLNCCNAAARLEKGYRQHTLSDTRKFIRRGKRLRGESRRDAKLEKEGTALLRKQ